MKRILLGFFLLSGTYLFAGKGDGNENPSCNCNLPDQVNIYAAGTATIIGGTQVECSGETGTCWEVTFKPSGGWTLTIYVEPPISFGNKNAQDDPPVAPYEITRRGNAVVYEWSTAVWK